jgi:hypothetical protein
VPYDWSNPYSTLVAYDVGNPLALSLTGIASAEAFGTGSVSPTGSAPVGLSGIPSAEAFGAMILGAPASLGGHGIPSAETFGVMVLNAPALLSGHGVPSAEAFGRPSVSVPFTKQAVAARCL